jgi:hypothetical protein
VPKLTSWYTNCYEGHETGNAKSPHWKCFKHWESLRSERESFRPRRFLDLKERDEHGGTIRLVSGADVDANTPYVALSYCW